MKQLMLIVLESLKTELGKLFCEEHPEEVLQAYLFFLMYSKGTKALRGSPHSPAFLVSDAP